MSEGRAEEIDGSHVCVWDVGVFKSEMDALPI